MLLTQRRYAFSISTRNCICFGPSARAQSVGPRPFACNSRQAHVSWPARTCLWTFQIYTQAKQRCQHERRWIPAAGQAMPSICVCFRLPFCGFACQLFHLVFIRQGKISGLRHDAERFGVQNVSFFVCFCFAQVFQCLTSVWIPAGGKKTNLCRTLHFAGFRFFSHRSRRCRILGVLGPCAHSST